MDITQAIILALIQGVTEFLPVSSSAHLVLLPDLAGWRNYLVFDVVVHLGSLCAVMFYYRKTLLCMCCCTEQMALEQTQTTGKELWLYLVVASLPLLLLGALLHDIIEGQLRTPLLIAAMTIVFAFFLWAANGVERSTTKLSLKAVFWIGLGQALALIPGVSRSGITITIGRFVGLSQRAAADFSFVLAIPVIAAASGYELLRLVMSPHPEVSALALITGFVVSAVVAFLSIGWFLRCVEKVGLMPFVIYRLLLGTVLLFIYL